MEFRWTPWNIDHLAVHGVHPSEAEFIVRHARPPFPEMIGEGKWYVAGQTTDGTYLQAIYVWDDEETAFVIHARPLDKAEKRQYRGRKR